MQLTASDGTALATNDNWVDDATISDVVQRIPAVPLTSGSADAALIATEPAGAYTALIRGSDGGSGVALVEAYEVPE
jgi:hypothetical protein